jgi:hypothetical protein
MNRYEPSHAHRKQQAGIAHHTLRFTSQNFAECVPGTGPTVRGREEGISATGNRCLIGADPAVLSVFYFDVQPISALTQHSEFNTRTERSTELWFVRLGVSLSHKHVVRNKDANRMSRVLPHLNERRDRQAQ